MGLSINRETRAITINASASLVWQWVAQLGQDRGGFYSYDILENLVGAQMPTEDYLRPLKQVWRPGDKLWMYPPSKGIRISGAPLTTYIPGRAIGFATTQNEFDDSRWNFYIMPIDDSHTRLLIRGQAPVSNSVLGRTFNFAIFDPAHFVMEKRMMIGIKQLSEGRSRDRLWNHVQVLLWVVTFALWIVSIFLTVRRRIWLRSFGAFISAAIVFQILTLAQPSVWIGLLLVFLLCWMLWGPVDARQSPRLVR
jgi:hypothetical protein